MELKEIVSWLDAQFAEYPVEDFSNNGLQIEASRTVDKVAYAVDACVESIMGAAAAGAQLLIVHHGLSWGTGFARIAGQDAQRIGLCFQAGVSLYAMHLPLDAHRGMGNNAVLAEALGGEELKPFAEVRGLKIGVLCRWNGTAGQLAEKVRALTGAGCAVHGDASLEVGRLAIVSGGGDGEIAACAAAGANVLLTGELRHSHAHEARELGVTVLSAGHYATETFGVRALARALEARFSCPVVEIPTDTGL
jgi:dinuclear metal center YbgI/SA1388 family protein